MPGLVRVVRCTIPNLDWASIVDGSPSEVDAFIGPVQLESERICSDPLLVRVTSTASPDLELVAIGLYTIGEVETLRGKCISAWSNMKEESK